MKFDELNTPTQNNGMRYFSENSIVIPDAYRNFLEQYNGGIPSNRLIYFNNDEKGTLIDIIFGFTKEKYRDLRKTNIDMLNRIPTNTLAIADDQGGNLILLSVKGPDYGKVYFWDHELETEPADYSNLTLIADSFEEFINNLKSEDEIK